MVMIAIGNNRIHDVPITVYRYSLLVQYVIRHSLQSMVINFSFEDIETGNE